jgi:2-hydroxychromene-2-carboxylate isomerase
LPRVLIVVRRPAPRFLYDFNSPYAYLAASRVDHVLPVTPDWQPIAFAFVLRARARAPWSFDPVHRVAGVAECERRAREYGLPPMRWPPGWPVESYSLLPLRAALAAGEQGRLREFSRVAFERAFVGGEGLGRPEDVAAVAARTGLDGKAVLARAGSDEIKHRLQEATEAAIALGVVGVPTVELGDQLFWGDDRLDGAAAAAADPG